MKIVFFYADLKEREIKLLEALKKGASKHGDVVEGVPTHEYRLLPDVDVAAIFGVKGNSRVLLSEYQKVGIHTLYMDKGYTRCCQKGKKYTKLVVDGFNRDDLGTLGHDSVRFDKLQGITSSYYEDAVDAPIIIAGSSAKFHEFAGLTNPMTYTSSLIKMIKKRTGRPIIYRPKPSWKDAEPIAGADFSRPPQTLQDLFNLKPHCLITYGSNAGVDAMFAGVPVISLTDLCVTANISSRELEDIGKVHKPDLEFRKQWLYDLAYQQWTNDEIASGLAWEHVRKDIRP